MIYTFICVYLFGCGVATGLIHSHGYRIDEEPELLFVIVLWPVSAIMYLGYVCSNKLHEDPDVLDAHKKITPDRNEAMSNGE